MCYNDECASTDIDKAQLFDKYFYSVFSLSLAPVNIPESPESQPSDQTFNDIQFTNCDVFELLTSLDVSKACGIDNLSPKVFKHVLCSTITLQIICHLFYTSISSSTIPHDWCTHCVVPIHKSGEKSSVSNYRPISL